MTPSGVDERVVEEWLARAHDDELNARAILQDRDGTAALVCFLGQQWTEKVLKAALVYFTGDAPFVHELPRLAEELGPHLPRLWSEFSSELKELSEYYVTARYPTEVPYASFTWERAERAFAAAQRVAAAIKADIKPSAGA